VSDQTIPTSVVARIRKLLSLAGNNSNEHEANAAAEKAQAIMADYNLTLAELGDGAAPTEESARSRHELSLSARMQWQTDLMASLANNNFCMQWTEVVRCQNYANGPFRMRKRHRLIGRQANVTVVIEMYQYLIGTMDRLCIYPDRRGRSATSWLQGCTDRLVSRLHDQRVLAEAASRARRGDPGRGSGSDLVLSDVYSSEEDLNTDLRYGYSPGTTARHAAENKARWATMRAAAPTPAPQAEPETEKAKAKREAADARWYAGYQRRQAKEAAKVDQWAYGQGSSAGEGIGLDAQIKAEGAKKVLSR
jgi:hypothetical protein